MNSRQLKSSLVKSKIIQDEIKSRSVISKNSPLYKKKTMKKGGKLLELTFSELWTLTKNFQKPDKHLVKENIHLNLSNNNEPYTT